LLQLVSYVLKRKKPPHPVSPL